MNGIGGRELVYLIKGRMPALATTGTILTNTGCSNILRLASGSRITVRHDHSMMNDPCLSPGERVRVKSLR